MVKKSLSKLSSIFVDTGVLIDLLKVDYSASPVEVVSRITQTKRFFVAIEELKKKVSFQTSAINIAELFHFDSNEATVMQAILTVIGGNEFEVFAFDEVGAMFHNQQFGTMLGNSVIEKLKKEVNYIHGNGFANVKDRIRKDILIASSAKQFQSDIVLTNDAGFKKLCDQLDLSCHLFTGKDEDFVSSGDGKKIYDFH